MELMTFGGALVAMKTAGGMVSGGVPSRTIPPATTPLPKANQPSRDGEADDTAAVTAEGIASDRVSIEDTPDAAASGVPCRNRGRRNEIPKANPSPPRPISTQIPKMTRMNIPMIRRR